MRKKKKLKIFEDVELKQELEKYAADLSKSTKMLELVGAMNPLEIIKAMQIKLELRPKQAMFLYANLLKNSLGEMITNGSMARPISDS